MSRPGTPLGTPFPGYIGQSVLGALEMPKHLPSSALGSLHTCMHIHTHIHVQIFTQYIHIHGHTHIYTYMHTLT